MPRPPGRSYAACDARLAAPGGEAPPADSAAFPGIRTTPANFRPGVVPLSPSCGSGTLAFVRGSFELAFEYDGEEYESGGTYLSLLRPDDEGSWRISHRTWSDR